VSGIAVICLAHLARCRGGTEIPVAGTALMVAPYYILEAAVQRVAAHLVANA
jgi:hypothetical protein